MSYIYWLADQIYQHQPNKYYNLLLTSFTLLNCKCLNWLFILSCKCIIGIYSWHNIKSCVLPLNSKNFFLSISSQISSVTFFIYILKILGNPLFWLSIPYLSLLPINLWEAAHWYRNHQKNKSRLYLLLQIDFASFITTS